MIFRYWFWIYKPEILKVLIYFYIFLSDFVHISNNLLSNSISSRIWIFFCKHRTIFEDSSKYDSCLVETICTGWRNSNKFFINNFFDLYKIKSIFRGFKKSSWYPLEAMARFGNKNDTSKLLHSRFGRSFITNPFNKIFNPFFYSRNSIYLIMSLHKIACNL